MNKLLQILDKFELIKIIIEKSDKKVSDVAVFIGLSREHLHRQIKDKKLSDDRIFKILEYLKISQSDFLEITKNDNFKPTYTGEAFDAAHFKEPPESSYGINIQLEKELDTANKRIRDLEKLVNLYEREIENLQKVADLSQLKNKQSTTKSIV